MTMKTKLFCILPALILLASLSASPRTVSSQSESSSLALAHANVIDGASNEPQLDVTVIVRNGKIEQIGKMNPPAGAEVIDLKGRWLLPGFVDAHAHISNLAAARAALQSGVTTARDLGVNVIKVMATERAGLPDTDPRKRVFNDEEIAAVVDEARKSGVYVAAHAHGDEGAYAAVKAGVRSIEHGTYLSDRTLALMKERGTYFDPTIATVADLIEPGGDYDNAILSIRGRHMLPRVRETAAKAWKLGIKMVAGTDTGYGPQSNRRIPHEVIELVEIGMPPMDAIKAATSVSAELLGVGQRTGSIKPGFEADFIAIERDPISDIKNLQDILLVVNDGKPAVNRLNW